jgi:competence protein ComEA
MMPRRYFLLIAFLFLFPAAVFAAGLVNINTADLATLETLNGIGPSKAQAIIDYRTQNGPFAAIGDIMNVSGIGTVTFNNIKDFITVSDGSSVQPPADAAAQTSTTTQTQSTTTAQTPGGAGPPPVSARITTGAAALAGAGTLFTGEAFDQAGEPLTSGVRYLWNFGDGAVAEGARVLHTFNYPGAYSVQLSVGYNYSSATARLKVAAAPAAVALVAEGDGSLTVADNSADDLDIGLWSLAQGTTSTSSGQASTFAIPEGTIVLAGEGVRFAPAVLHFDGGMAAVLYYPNGAPAASAAAGAHSPLRGERVVLASAQGGTQRQSNAASASQPAPTVKGTDQAAAVATAPASKEIQWSYLVGLAAVIALGAVGTYYAHTKPQLAVTDAAADEFEIE